MLAFTLCPLADEPKHTDAPEYPPVNPVGTFSINYVSSAAAYSGLFAIPTQHDHVPERESNFHFSMPSAVMASGQNMPPFVAGPDGNDAVIFQSDARRRAQWMLDTDSVSMSAAVVWFASTQAKKL